MSAPDMLTLAEPVTVAAVRRELLEPAAPAAGAHFVHTVEGRWTTRLLAVHARLVTDANVAARELVLEYRNDQDYRVALHGAPVTQSASDTVDYLFNVHQPRAEWEVNGSVLVPLSPLPLPPSWDARLFVVNVQATDQLSLIRLLVERWPTDGPK